MQNNILNTPHYKSFFDETYLLKKHILPENSKKSIAKLITNAKKNESSDFILRANLFVLLWSILDLAIVETPIYEVKKFTIYDFIFKVEEMLSKNFETPLSKIHNEAARNGFSQVELAKLFKEKNNSSLLEYRQIQRIKLALELLNNGHQISEVSRQTGFKSTSKFIEYFSKEKAVNATSDYSFA